MFNRWDEKGTILNNILKLNPYVIKMTLTIPEHIFTLRFRYVRNSYTECKTPTLIMQSNK